MQGKQMKISYFHVIANMLTGQRAFRGDERSPVGFLTLTTTGRKSGLPRSVHLTYIRDGADYVLCASLGGAPRDPGWLYNLRHNPKVTLNAHGRVFEGIAEVADPEKRKALWAQLVAIAPMYAQYEKRTTRVIQMVIVHPSPSSDK